MRRRCFAVVAPVGGGKTTALRRVAEAFPGRVAGTLALRVRDQQGEGYNLLLLPSGRQRPLVRQQGPGLRVGRFFLREEVLAWGIRYLERQRPALWILDEVGPLELQEHRGWWPWLRRMVQEPGAPLVAAVRRELLGRLRRALPMVSWEVYGPEEVDRLVALLRRLIG